MKASKSLFFILFCFLIYNKTKAQSGNLLNIKLNGSNYALNNIALPTQSSFNYGNFGPTFAGGRSTYDRINNRYFTYGTEIYVIDALTGSVLDTLPLPSGMINIEYDELCNCLVGGSFQNNFYKIDLITKNVTNYTFSSGGEALLSEKSTFDRINQRYFFVTNMDVRGVDTAGAFSIAGIGKLRAIEYDASLNSIFGIFLTLPPRFTRVDLTTMTGTSLSAMPDNNYFYGENTYDEVNHHYYIKSPNGVLVLNAITGNTIALIPYTGAGMEYANLPSSPGPGQTTGIQMNSNHLMPFIFPNPGDGHFYVANTNEEMTIEVSDAFGKQILKRQAKMESDHLDLSEYTPGIYFYRLTHNSQALLNGKLVVKK